MTTLDVESIWNHLLRCPVVHMYYFCIKSIRNVYIHENMESANPYEIFHMRIEFPYRFI